MGTPGNRILDAAGNVLLQSDGTPWLYSAGTCACCTGPGAPQYQLNFPCNGNGAGVPTNLTAPLAGVQWSANQQQCVYFPNKFSPVAGAADTYTPEGSCTLAPCGKCLYQVAIGTGITYASCVSVNTTPPGYSSPPITYPIDINFFAGEMKTVSNEFTMQGTNIAAGTGLLQGCGVFAFYSAGSPVICPSSGPGFGSTAQFTTAQHGGFLIDWVLNGDGTYDWAIIKSEGQMPSWPASPVPIGVSFFARLLNMGGPSPALFTLTNIANQAVIGTPISWVGQQYSAGQQFFPIGSGGYVSCYPRNIICPMNLPGTLNVSGGPISVGYDHFGVSGSISAPVGTSVASPWDGTLSLTTVPTTNCGNGAQYTNPTAISSWDGYAVTEVQLSFGIIDSSDIGGPTMCGWGIYVNIGNTLAAKWALPNSPYPQGTYKCIYPLVNPQELVVS